ncbi:MAG: signal peptidase II [Thermoleophilia bacterium]|nr:signal peptidase II [Thermoleophilia bacterium]
MFLIILLLVAADQATKFLVRYFLDPGESVQVLSFFSINHIQNPGIAFGMLGNYGSLIVFVTTMVVFILIVAAMMVRNDGHMFWPLILLVAGSSGNLIDRFTRKSVTDFIDFSYWPAFNLADIFIVTGVILLILALVLRPSKTGESPQA